MPNVVPWDFVLPYPPKVATDHKNLHAHDQNQRDERLQNVLPKPSGHNWEKGVVDLPVGEVLYPSEGMRTTITRNGDRCTKCGLRRVPMLLGTAYMSRTDDGNLMYEIQHPEE